MQSSPVICSRCGRILVSDPKNPGKLICAVCDLPIGNNGQRGQAAVEFTLAALMTAFMLYLLFALTPFGPMLTSLWPPVNQIKPSGVDCIINPTPYPGDGRCTGNRK